MGLGLGIFVIGSEYSVFVKMNFHNQFYPHNGYYQAVFSPCAVPWTQVPGYLRVEEGEEGEEEGEGGGGGEGEEEEGGEGEEEGDRKSVV